MTKLEVISGVIILQCKYHYNVFGIGLKIDNLFK